MIEINYDDDISKLVNDISQLEEDVIKIDSQLRVAKEEMNFTGIPTNSEWLRKANFALKMKKKQIKNNHTKIFELKNKQSQNDKKMRREEHRKIVEEQKLLTVEKEKIKQERYSQIERNFVDIAKVTLEESLFKKIMLAAVESQGLLGE